ncbi:guanylate kinase [Candidatus Saccharibacteria bacterium]|nr:MAG: guanylate kinase [Candidatus Saccharibacteria bacterium]
MEVQLEKKEEFKKALACYSPSQDARDTLATMPLVILLSVTGGGRNTIINELVKTGRYHYIVSDTTRPAKVRNGKLEQDGVVYHFRTEDEVLADIKQGLYLEAELIHDQQVSGTSVRELKRAHDSGKVPINEVDIGGTDAIADVKPDTLFLFIVPPSYTEWMRRLKSREDMSEEELEKRLTTAVRMLHTVLSSKRFVFVVNDRLSEVVKTVDDYILGERHDLHDATAKAVALRLYHQILEHYPHLAATD